MEFNAVQVTKGEDDTGGHKEPTEILSCTAVSVPAARPADTTKPESWPLALPVGAAVYCLDSCSAAVPLARSFIRHQTMHWDLGASVTDDACLVVTELVTNAVQHSGSDDVTVSLVQGCTFLWVHVADHGCWRDCVAPPAEQIWEGGRGLALVAAVASAYDRHSTSAGTRVWAALAKGEYGARGIKGHEAVARQLDALAGYIATPVTARRGLLAGRTTSPAPTTPAPRRARPA